MKKHGILFLAIAAAALTLISCQAPAPTPSDLTFPPLQFDPPDPQAFRVEIDGSLRAYIKEARELPIFNLSALVHFGSLYEPKDKQGLAALMSGTLIKGGTAAREGAAIEERLDFLGGSLYFNVSERTATLNLSVLSKDLDEGLDIFFDILRSPAFRADALKLSKARLIEGLRQANDSPGAVLNREYERVLYGDHPLTWSATKASYEGLGVTDLKAAHARYFVPGNMILAASGDFASDELKAAIARRTAGWADAPVEFPVIPKDFPTPEPGVYFVQKAINQGYVSLGHLGIEDTDPDFFAVQVMNFILGGGSFTSRITTKVRSDEGLSYSQGSRFSTRWGFPGPFSGFVQTKSSTVGYAISLILAEMNRIRTEPVSDAEMDTAVNYYIDSFASQFEMPQATMMSFANLEMTGKPMDYFRTLRDKIRAVTKERVREVAEKFIRPDEAVIMVVGDWGPCDKGGDQWPGPLEKLGKVHRVGLFDPFAGKMLD